MCGILGSVNVTIDKSLLNLLSHRGPDDEGFMTEAIEGEKVYLGHRRLSIVDLSEAGHQPMVSRNNNSVIIFNGEIYNHNELRNEITGVIFRGHSDTETLVNFLEERGIRETKRLNGIFAFAFLDKSQCKLYLVRDRFGVKPLYYYVNGKKVVFSSEIRPIRTICNLEVDLKSVAEFLKYRYNPSPNTLYKNLFKVCPGHYVEIDLKTFSIREKPFFSKKIEKIRISLKDALEEYGFLLEQAIRRQLMSDVEVGLLLSGGIDSALIAYFAKKHYDGNLRTFTIGFNEDDISNELEEARRTSEIIGTRHSEVRIGINDFFEVLKDVNKIVEEPSSTTSQIPMYFLLREASKKVKVVLTGQGADEPLGGYMRHCGERYLSRLPHQFFYMISTMDKLLEKRHKLYKGIHAYSEKETIARFEKIYSLFEDSEIERLMGTKISVSIRDQIQYLFELYSLSNLSSFQSMLSVDTRTSLADDLLLYTDKISMNFSVEARVPMLDNELIDFVESLPDKYKVSRLVRKYIHKKFATKVLPKEIVYRQKKGFYSPTRKWFKKELLRRVMKEIIDSDVLSFLSEIEIKKIFDSHLRGEKNNERKIFQILSLYNILS